MLVGIILIVVGDGLAVVGVVALAAVLVINVIWAAGRARRTRIRTTGTRVPAHLVSSVRVGPAVGSVAGVLGHIRQTWQAPLPAGGSKDFVVRTSRKLQDGYVLEASARRGEVALMLDLDRDHVARDDALLFESHRAALALDAYDGEPIEPVFPQDELQQQIVRLAEAATGRRLEVEETGGS